MQTRGILIPSSLRVEIPEGAAGTRETLKQMRRLVQLGKTNLALRDLTASIIAAVPGKDFQGELQALLDFVRQAIRYTLDTNDIEVIQCPITTWRLGYGDCDDMAVLLATLCELAGHPAAFIAIGFGEIGQYSHVMVMASPADESAFVFLDPTEAMPPGWFPAGVTCRMICPITATAETRLTGATWP